MKGRFGLCLVAALVAHALAWHALAPRLLAPRTPHLAPSSITVSVVHEQLAGSAAARPERNAQRTGEPPAPPTCPPMSRLLTVSASPLAVDPPEPRIGDATSVASAPPAESIDPGAAGADEATVKEVAVTGSFRPVYPRACRRRGEQGEVTLHIRVNASCRAGEVSVTRSSGFRPLDEAARNAARDAVYSAAGELDLVVSFKLSDT